MLTPKHMFSCSLSIIFMTELKERNTKPRNNLVSPLRTHWTEDGIHTHTNLRAFQISYFVNNLEAFWPVVLLIWTLWGWEVRERTNFGPWPLPSPFLFFIFFTFPNEINTPWYLQISFLARVAEKSMKVISDAKIHDWVNVRNAFRYKE